MTSVYRTQIEIRIRKLKPNPAILSTKISGFLGRLLTSRWLQWRWLRPADIVFGVLAFILSAIVIASPGVAVTTLVIFLYFALFVRGVAALTMAGAGKMIPSRLRAALGVVGVLSIILAIVFLAFPGLALGTLIFLLSIGLLFVGIEAIASGVVGREIVPVIGSVQSKDLILHLDHKSENRGDGSPHYP